MATKYEEHTHRVVWEPGRGYRAQRYVDGSGWQDTGQPDRPSDPEARLDCKLDAKAGTGRCDIAPIVCFPDGYRA